MSDSKQEKQLIIEGKTLLGSLEKQSERVAKGIEDFDKRLKELSDTNFMMQNTPRKFADKLEEKIPRIVEELHKSVMNEINAVKDNYNEEMLMHERFLKGSESHIQSHLDNFSRLEKSKVKRFFLGVIMSSIIATSAAIFAASYYVKGKFLQNVSVTHPDKIYLQDSEAKIIDWGKSKTYIQTPNKKNKR